MGDDIRIEGEEKDCEDSGERAGAFPGHPVEKIRGEETEEDDGETREKNEEIGVIAETVEEEGPDIPLFVDALGPERIGDGEDRREREEEEPDEVLQEWRMLVIDTHISIADIAVGCGNMRPFIVGGGIGPGRPEREPEENGEHERYDDCRVMLHELKELMHKFYRR